MKKMTKALVWVSVVASIALLVGCTAQVRPTISPSEYITNAPRLPATVALYFSDEFRNYAPKHDDPANFRSWILGLGPLATDAYTYAFEGRFEKVLVKAGEPQFPLPGGSVDYVVTPRFVSLNAGEPVFVKFENYWVELAIDVRIQDADGKNLETLHLKSKGVKRGAIGTESPGVAAYPVACREAVKPLVDQTVDRVIELMRR